MCGRRTLCRPPGVAGWCLLGVLLLENLLAAPQYLSFYNAAAGRGYPIVSDFDWGQSLLDLRDWMRTAQTNWRQALSIAQREGVPVPAMSASLAYFDSYRAASLPQNLTQAQRDFFGAHTYRRKDKPELGAIHTDWEDAADKRG